MREFFGKTESGSEWEESLGMMSKISNLHWKAGA